ncbi:hypothetical protein AMTR_s00009p00126150 [Amborella trichopoda]|uniref:Uncharacterized protein n=1 Tax=Amborella trichopoda TaxID=13333 RepID=W1NGG1_AMBTC|nr:hypothetical protein AMTR_s00009p00126150 [Amborella trichopoda]
METSTIEDQPSVRDMLQKVLDCICDQRYGIIGVYRMGGVGKTTLMAKVNNSFKSNPYFDIVIMVIVSAYPNVTKIENRIGERLGLDLSSGDEEAARHKLLGASKRKKYLLILDDLWQEDEIGIPQPKNESGCKILVTSRNQYVSTEMGTEFTIEVKKFSVSESWSLFVAKAGQHVISPSIKPHAKIIVRKCEGLPLAIITIAHAMANRDTVREWEDAIRELRQSASSLRGMKDKVFDSLKFSYDRLESDLHKLFFLFCALYPEDYSISQYELAIHCLGEGLVDRLGSLKATQNKVAALVGSLRTSCMLENGEGEGEGEVRMHDMMRKLALWITSLESKDNLKFLVRARASLKEAPEATEWKEVDIISLMGNELEDLPKLSECCPKLVTLLLHENFTLKSIPSSSFFEYMECLRVLNLSYTRIESYIEWRVDDDEGEGDGSGSEGKGTIHDIGELTQLIHLSRLGINLENITISNWFKPLARSMESLVLKNCRCQGVTRVPTSVSHALQIESCEELECLVVGKDAKDDGDGDRDGDDHSFQSLRDLWLKLKVVFTKGMAPHLSNLVDISVRGCGVLQKLIEEDEDDGNNNNGGSFSSSSLLTLSKLRNLALNFLPQLSHICSKSVLHWPLIDNVWVMACPQLKKTPLWVRNARGLLFIRGKALGPAWRGEVVES